MPSEILATKLFIPPLRTDYVPRPHLVTRLQEGINRKLTLLSTPAGFGKTTLLCEWIQAKDLCAAWLSLDEGDNTMERFVAYLFAAFEIPVVKGRFQSMRRAQMESLLTGLLNHAANGEQVVLILNDYHVIREQGIHDAVNYLLEYCPPQLHIVITTRTDPPLALAKLRALGQVNELRTQDLRFSREEAAKLLNGVFALGFSDSHIAALEERTEGWVAGLQLATLAMSGRKDIDRFVQSFVGSHRYVLDYLTDEALDRQSEATLDFLLKTSILERMTAGLCNAVMGIVNSQTTLELLERENIFIVPLDDERKWYRYHHLFSDLLRYRLQNSLPDERPKLHRRAAEWCAENWQTYEAIRHALAANDDALAIRIVEEASPVLAMQGDVNHLLALLNALPKLLAKSSANLMLINAWAHLFMMDINAVNGYIQEALRILRTDPPLVASNAILGQVNALQAFVEVYRGNPERAIELAQDALQRLPVESNVGRFAVYAALGDAYRDVDNFASASQTYAEAVKAFAAMNQQIASLTIRMDLVRLRAKMGHLNQAVAMCEETIAQGGEDTRPLFPVAQAIILLGDIWRERNELDRAEELLQTGIRQCEEGGYFRYLVTGHILMARVMFARDDWGRMETSLAEASQAARESGAETLIRFVEMYRVRLRVGMGADVESNQKWAKQFETDSPPVNISSEDGYLTLARVRLVAKEKSSLKKSLVCLDELLRAAQQSERMGSVIEIRMLQALTFFALGQVTDSLDCLNHALRLAEPQGYVQLFADEGAPMAELLRLASQRSPQREYAARLLRAINISAQKPQEAFTEILTERELEILNLLNIGLSNQQISEKLFVSVSTVKTHVAHLFDKFGVNSRTKALVRARERGLL